MYVLYYEMYRILFKQCVNVIQHKTYKTGASRINISFTETSSLFSTLLKNCTNGIPWFSLATFM